MINKLRYVTFNNDYCPILDRLFNKNISSGIKSVTAKDNYYLYITFNNGNKLKVWNTNKYYGWLNEGSFIDENKKHIYTWFESRPKRKTMIRFRKLLERLFLEI